METAYRIFEYLPLKHKNPSDSDYFAFLTHSVEQNYEAGNYHFAVVALHMIYMGIVYHYIYGIFRADKKRFEYVMIGFHEKLEVKEVDNISWHSFSNVNESTIFQFYRSVGIPKEQIGNLKAPVKNRNEILHANGIYLTSEDDFEKSSQKYLQNLKKIQKFCAGEYRALFFQFLNEIKIDIENEDEATLYLQDDFIQEFGINLKTVRFLSKIKESEYPIDKKPFYVAINEMTETENE
ncbi:conserved hypothetical protein [Candidatus Desulfarcum epimagneticum]|uniref:Uncharacterized protein n=1 Tax=uncultured Desulfobacteraceae bacterium TaxID=218296 RepID=A0A484HNU3_9BACT|nr:conserved hypothetical protein [uncultured Desulfobacteraceae bacterium]